MLARVLRSPDPPPSLSTRIETARLILRPPRTGDLPDLRRAMRENTEHLRRWSPAPLPGEDPASITAISKLILRQRREWKRGESYVLLALERTAEGRERIIGRVAFSGVMRGVFQNTYLGYWIDRDRQGRGYMTEVVQAGVSWAFETAVLHRVQAAVMPVNEASLRVLEKAGFRREGLAERYLCIAGKWEDHVILARTAEEPIATRPPDLPSS